MARLAPEIKILRSKLRGYKKLHTQLCEFIEIAEAQNKELVKIDLLKRIDLVNRKRKEISNQLELGA
jgi:tRNA U34 5-methylaminomethyl-2-thiouridine-forming methyltransferase MnmC